jgi:hypothetical protein
MSLNKFKLLSESDDHFELEHPKGEKFKVSKGKLTPVAVQAIQGLAKGGCVGYADGGTAQVPYYLSANQAEPQDPAIAQPADLALQQLQKPISQMQWAPSKQQRESDYQQRIAQLTDRGTDPLTGMSLSLPNEEAEDIVGQQMKMERLAPQSAAEAELQKQIVERQNTNRARINAGLDPLPEISVPLTQAAQAARQIPSPNVFQQQAGAMEDIYGKQQKSLEELQSGMKQSQAAQEATYNELIKKMAEFKSPDEIAKDFKEKDTNLYKQIVDAKLDPDRYLHSLSTGQKIGNAIALALGGLAGRGQGNVALDMMNRAISNDVELQKADVSRKMNLYQMNRNAMKDAYQAELATRNQIMTLAQTKLAQAGNIATNANAQFQLQNMFNQLEQQKAQNRYQLALMQGGGAGGMSGAIDPAQLVPVMMQRASPAEREKAFKEIEAAQDTARMGDAIMKSFEDAAKENTILRTGAGLLRTPSSVLALHQALQPTFKDLEGTVRQSAMDNTFKNITPMPGDSEYTINYKRQALREYLASKASAPVSKAYGINLETYPSTSTNWMTRKSPEVQTYYQYAIANPNNPISQAFLKKEGIR